MIVIHSGIFMKRLAAISIELNVSVEKLIKVLADLNPSIFYGPNSKVDQEAEQFLALTFAQDKERIDKVREEENVELKWDKDFTFSKDEKEEFSDLFSYYSKTLKELNLIETSSKQYWALSNEELKALKSYKIRRINDIQSDLNIERNKISISKRIKYHSKLKPLGDGNYCPRCQEQPCMCSDPDPG